VLAYPEDTTLEVTLVSGRVDIRQELPGGDRTLYKMQPDEHLLFQKQARKLVPSPVSSEKYIGWKAGKLIFENDPMDEVIGRLSRWFHVEFELEDPELANYTYTATFVSETLPQVLELMQLASPIDYQITPRALQPDGSYSKMKVSIRRK
jgi:ferric-dicitrate binding protein FerR (iron transport regulator)